VNDPARLEVSSSRHDSLPGREAAAKMAGAKRAARLENLRAAAAMDSAVDATTSEQ
jgi:peptide subunit release factor 1 (eRF1)